MDTSRTVAPFPPTDLLLTGSLMTYWPTRIVEAWSPPNAPGWEMTDPASHLSDRKTKMTIPHRCSHQSLASIQLNPGFRSREKDSGHDKLITTSVRLLAQDTQIPEMLVPPVVVQGTIYAVARPTFYQFYNNCLAAASTSTIWISVTMTAKIR